MKFSRFALALVVLIPCAAFAQGGVEAVVVGPVADPPGAAQAALPLQVLQAQLRHLLEQQGPVALLPERTEVRRPGQKVQETPD
jgi:hypothetical protein